MEVWIDSNISHRFTKEKKYWQGISFECALNEKYKFIFFIKGYSTNAPLLFIHRGIVIKVSLVEKKVNLNKSVLSPPDFIIKLPTSTPKFNSKLLTHE